MQVIKAKHWQHIKGISRTHLGISTHVVIVSQHVQIKKHFICLSRDPFYFIVDLR